MAYSQGQTVCWAIIQVLVNSKKIEITQSIFPYHSGMKLEVITEENLGNGQICGN